MKVWPFLFTSGHYQEYQIVVCPDFIKDSDQLKAFRSKLVQLNSNPAEMGEIAEESIIMPRVGKLSIIYKSEEATENSAPARDFGDRPITRVSGFICNSPMNFSKSERNSLFQFSMDIVNAAFLRFFRAKHFEPIFAPALSSGSDKTVGKILTSVLVALALSLSGNAYQFLTSQKIRAITSKQGLPLDTSQLGSMTQLCLMPCTNQIDSPRGPIRNLQEPAKE